MGAWIAIVVLFVIGAWPIALIILFIKLFGSDSRRKQQTVPPWSRRHSRQAALPPRRRQQSQKGRAQRHEVPGCEELNAKWLKIVGAVLTVCGLAACWSPIDMMIWLGYAESWYIEELLWAWP